MSKRKQHLSVLMKVHGLMQRGTSFPRALFESGPVSDRAATFDAAYDLSCEVLGMHRLEVLVDDDKLRFVPSLL